MTDRLTIGLLPKWMWKCHRLLQKGVHVTIPEGCRLLDMLVETLGLDPAYIAERIQTVLIDGRPVDDVDTAMLHPGAHVSLSGALPGLAGATLRKGGYYAGLRQSISYTCDMTTESGRRGSVMVKLFNVVLKEVGPKMLAQGIAVTASEAMAIFNECLEQDPAAVVSMTLNGESLAWAAVQRRWSGKDTITLSVKPED